MIRTNAAATGSVTVDEFYAQVEDGQKADLIDGVIYMASPDSPRADDLHLLIAGLMRFYVTTRKIGGKAFGSRVAFELNEHNAPEPDIAFLRRERLHLVKEGRVAGPPDIAVEIACEGSHERDYEIKKGLYENAGVSEYWIIDPAAKHVEFWVLRDGRYETLTLEDNRWYRSTVIPGFCLDTEGSSPTRCPMTLSACRKS